MRTPLLLTLAAVASLAAAGGGEAAQGWTRFSSSAGFSVDRPVGWVAAGNSPAGGLHIVSGPCRHDPAIICGGEAQILVTSEASAGKPAHARACWNLAQAAWEDEIGPGAFEQVRRLSCTIGARHFTITERHWKGDKHAASYGRITMRMAKSLRYPG